MGAARQVKLTIVASAYISGIELPRFSKKVNADAILVDNTKYRRVQRAVAAASFCGSVKERFYTALIAKECHETLIGTRNDQVSCWFGRFLHFVRIVRGKTMYSRCDLHDSSHCLQCA